MCTSDRTTVSPSRIAVGLAGPAQTLLGPLRARAGDARRTLALLGDRRSAEIHARLDYAAPSGPEPQGPLGPVVRSLVIDDVVRGFLSRSPAATVVELGAGLSTRFERLDNGCLRWFDLDLPDVIALRQRLLSPDPRRTHLAASALDPAWLAAVVAARGPWCFVLEAMVGYLPGDAARRLLAQLARQFPGATVVLDIGRGHAVVGDTIIRTASGTCGLTGADPALAIARWGIGLELVATTRFLGTSPRRRPTRLAAVLDDRRDAGYQVATFRAGAPW